MRWLVALCVLLGLAAPALAKPKLELAARKGRVTVFAEKSLGNTAEDLADRAEEALARIAEDLAGLPQPRAIEVRLVNDSKDLASVAPAGRGAPQWAVGVAYPDLGVVSVAIHRQANYIEPIATLKHELAHLALGAALGDRAPRWLHEGFAYQHSAEWSRERIDTLSGMAFLGTTIPIAELDREFPAQELVAHRAYAQSYDFVGFLSRRGRWDDASDDGDRYPFRRFLRLIGDGSTVDDAATKAFGRPLRALFDEWKEDLEKRYGAPVGLLGFLLWIGAAVLLVLAWRRRRRQNRQRLALWELEEITRREAARTAIVAPPYVAWPGDDDPFDDELDDRPKPPRLMN